MHGLFPFRRQTLRKGGRTGYQAGPLRERGIVWHCKIEKRPEQQSFGISNQLLLFIFYPQPE